MPVYLSVFEQINTLCIVAKDESYINHVKNYVNYSENYFHNR